jgi:hypothetical protein
LLLQHGAGPVRLFGLNDNSAIVSHIDFSGVFRQRNWARGDSPAIGAMNMIKGMSTGLVLASSTVRGHFFVSFTGRYACGRPEISLTH